MVHGSAKRVSSVEMLYCSSSSLSSFERNLIRTVFLSALADLLSLGLQETSGSSVFLFLFLGFPQGHVSSYKQSVVEETKLFLGFSDDFDVDEGGISITLGGKERGYFGNFCGFWIILVRFFSARSIETSSFGQRENVRERET